MSDPGAGIVAGSCWTEQLCRAPTAWARRWPPAGRWLSPGWSTTSSRWAMCRAPRPRCATPAATSSVCSTRRAISNRASATPRRWCRWPPPTSRTACCCTRCASTGCWPSTRGRSSWARSAPACWPSTKPGRLAALNARASQLLQGLDPAPGTAFERLFGEPFELVTARLQRQGEQRLRDAFGSSLVAMCLGRPTATPGVGAAFPGPLCREAPPPARRRGAPRRPAPWPTPHANQAVAQAAVEAAVRRNVPLLLIWAKPAPARRCWPAMPTAPAAAAVPSWP